MTLGNFYSSQFRPYKPKDLKETKVPMVAPYFADADSRASGMVYYRWTDDATLLTRAKEDIGVSGFEPNSLFIATWDNVGFYDQHSNLVSPQ